MIVTRRRGAVLTIAFDRAAARNAMSIAGWDALADAAQAAGQADAAAVVLASDVPGVFSAGADLAMLATLIDDVPARVRFRTAMRGAIDRLAALPMPVIAAVDGDCYGAAVAVTLAADICIAGARAAFAVTPAKLGIGYPGEDVARLVARVGRGQASRLLFSAQPIAADEALRIGLADLTAPLAIDAAAALADRIATNAPGAVRLLKRTIDGGGDDAPFDAAFGGDEFAGRLAAFRARKR